MNQTGMLCSYKSEEFKYVFADGIWEFKGLKYFKTHFKIM